MFSLGNDRSNSISTKIKVAVFDGARIIRIERGCFSHGWNGRWRRRPSRRVPSFSEIYVNLGARAPK